MTRRRILAMFGAAGVVPLSVWKARARSSVAVHFMTVQDVARRIKSRELSPVDLTRQILERRMQHLASHRRLHKRIASER